MLSRWLPRAIGLLLMFSALALSLSRAPERPVEGLVARWAAPPSDLIDLDGQLVHLRDEGPRGDASPIVLLHGAGGSLHVWDGWARALRGQRRVISLDLPGSGITGRRVAPADDYSAAANARFVLAVLDQLRVARAVVVGQGLGGEAAWHAAALAPQRVQKLVLIAPSGLQDMRSQPLLFRAVRTPGMRWSSAYFLPREMVTMSLQTLYGDPLRVSAALVERVYELTLREGNRDALGLQLDHAGRAGPLPAVQAPVLLLWGEADRVFAPSSAEAWVRAAPGSRLVRLPGLGHWPQEESPAASLKAAEGFL